MLYRSFHLFYWQRVSRATLYTLSSHFNISLNGLLHVMLFFLIPISFYKSIHIEYIHSVGIKVSYHEFPFLLERGIKYH